MVSLERINQITNQLPKFDGAGDLQSKSKQAAASLETMGNLERDLLHTQLSDLDHWITKVRDVELRSGHGHPLPSYPDEEDLVPAGVESLLRAQVQELEGWLIEARTPAKQNPPPINQCNETDEDLLMSVRRERSWAVRRDMKPKDETMHAQQRVESAFTALSHMKDAETQRELALQQTRSVGLQTAEDFGRLFNQLHELEADPMRAPDLARYSMTDVALALVNAIETRRALATTLEAALRAQDRVRLHAEGYEQLLTCAAALPLITAHAANEGSESPEILYAPAGQLTLPEGPLGVHSVDVQEIPVNRMHKLAERNRALWQQLYGHWDVAARSRAGTLGLKGVVPTFLETGSFAVGNLGQDGVGALKSELLSLRSNEGRLDALLVGGHGMLSPGVNEGSPNINVPSVQSFIERELELEKMLKPKKVSVFGKFDMGPFSLFTMEEIVQAWGETAAKLALWRRTRRAEAGQRFLSKKTTAKALRWWLGGLMYEIEQIGAMPNNIKRGDRVKDLSNGRIGTFLSATPKGICKIQWDKNELSLRPKSMLAWMRKWPHPAYGGLFFLAWARILIQRENQMVLRYRQKVMGTKDQGKSSNLIVWLSAQSADATTLARICFESWGKMTYTKRTAMHDLLADILMVWKHGTMTSRHSRAVNELERASGEIRSARLDVVRQTRRFEKVEQRLRRIDDMQGTLFLSYVMASWHYAIRMERMSQSAKMVGRDERLRLALQLSNKLQAQTLIKMLPAILAAWHGRVRQRLQANKTHATLSVAFTSATLSLAFQEWKGMVQGHHTVNAEKEVAVLTAKLLDKEEEFKRLTTITEELYTFAKEADVRVKQLEGALGAADKAIDSGANHSGVLEKEVSSLETQLKGMEARVRRGEEAERELKQERDSASALKIDLANTRGERESLQNKIGVIEQTMAKIEEELATEKRQVSALDAEKAIIESSLEASRADALEWKLRYEEEASDYAAGVGELSDESDILEALEDDEDGYLTKKGKKDLKKAVKLGKVSEEKAKARRDGDWKSSKKRRGGAKEDPKVEQAKDRVWVPDGEVPAWKALMDYERAQVIVEQGADFMLEKPGFGLFGGKSLEKGFFTVYEDFEDRYLVYWRDKDQVEKSDARGAFTLKDVASAHFDFKTQVITLNQSSTKKKDASRTLKDVDSGFFEALLVVTREAEYRRVKNLFSGSSAKAARVEEAEAQIGRRDKDISPRDASSPRGGVSPASRLGGAGFPGLSLPTVSPLTPSKDPKRDAARQARQEAREKAMAERLASG